MEDDIDSADKKYGSRVTSPTRKSGGMNHVIKKFF